MAYSYEVRFTRVFLLGSVLAGLTVPASLRFCDIESAQVFVTEVLSHPLVKRPVGGGHRPPAGEAADRRPLPPDQPLHPRAQLRRRLPPPPPPPQPTHRRPTWRP